MAQLDGSAAEVLLAPGVVLRAPGLVGTAEIRVPGPALVRGRSTPATEGFAAALARAELIPRQVVELAVSQQVGAPPAPALTTRGGRPGMELQVPAPGAGFGQVLLLSDEHGVMSWHYPQARPSAAPAARGSTVDRFVIPSDSARSAAADGGTAASRSLLTLVGKKLLSVLVYPLVEGLIAKASLEVARRWELENRPSRLRTFNPGEQSQPPGSPFAQTDVARLAEGRSLLFLHGVFSTSHGSFGGLSDQTLSTLHQAYSGRVFAFDHPTLSVNPADNASALLDLLPAGQTFDIDIVCHSRGGLVARVLAGELGARPGLRVHRVIFVGTPNAGTAILTTDHIVDLLDRFTSLLNLLPPGPWTMVVDVLDAVLEVVKVVGQGAVAGLIGLSCMATGSTFVKGLNAAGVVPAEYYAVDANYQPTGGLALLCRAGNVAVDLVFGGVANDVAVPSSGVGTVTGDDMFPVDPRNTLSFGPDEGVWHCSYFQQPKTEAALVNWLQ